VFVLCGSWVCGLLSSLNESSPSNPSSKGILNYVDPFLLSLDLVYWEEASALLVEKSLLNGPLGGPIYHQDSPQNSCTHTHTYTYIYDQSSKFDYRHFQYLIL
jgi:hypothetical protein